MGLMFTSVMDRIDAGLVYRLEGCQCQDPDEAISESACLALVNFTGLPLSDFAKRVCRPSDPRLNGTSSGAQTARASTLTK